MATEKDYAVLEDTKRLGLLAKIKQWWLRLIREEYHLTVYFVVAAVSNPETGEKTVTRTKKTFKLKSVNKRKQNHFTGIIFLQKCLKLSEILSMTMR